MFALENDLFRHRKEVIGKRSQERSDFIRRTFSAITVFLFWHNDVPPLAEITFRPKAKLFNVTIILFLFEPL